MAAGGDIPHDLATFVIEDALGIEYGFWGCVAAGATFKTLGRKRTPQGRAVIADHLLDLDDAERRVNEIYFTWRAGRPTSLDRDLDSMLARWRTLGDDDELVLTWPMSPARSNRHITVATTFATIDDYIAGFPSAVQDVLRQIRRTMHDACRAPTRRSATTSPR